MTEDVENDEVFEDVAEPTPDETAEAEEPEKPTGEGKPDPEQQPPDIGKSKRSYRRQISKLKRELEELKRAQQPPPARDEQKEPKRDDYENYEDYLEERAKYIAEQKIVEAEHQREERDRARQSEHTHKQLVDSWEDKKEDARERYDDFDEVVEEFDGEITRPIADAMLESSIGADVAYYLGKHPEAVERIAKLSPVRQIAEMGKIENTVQAAIDKLHEDKPSNAPPPVVPNKGGRAADDSLNPKDPIDDWMVKFRKRRHGR